MPKQTISEHEVDTIHNASSSTATTDTTTNTTDVKHEVDQTTTVTTYADKNGKWGLGLIGSVTLYSGKLQATPSYGASVSYRLLGPVSAAVSAYSDKNLLAGLDLSLGKNWSLSADVGNQFGKPLLSTTAAHSRAACSVRCGLALGITLMVPRACYLLRREVANNSLARYTP